MKLLAFFSGGISQWMLALYQIPRLGFYGFPAFDLRGSQTTDTINRKRNNNSKIFSR